MVKDSKKGRSPRRLKIVEHELPPTLYAVADMATRCVLTRGLSASGAKGYSRSWQAMHPEATVVVIEEPLSFVSPEALLDSFEGRAPAVSPLVVEIHQDGHPPRLVELPDQRPAFMAEINRLTAATGIHATLPGKAGAL